MRFWMVQDFPDIPCNFQGVPNVDEEASVSSNLFNRVRKFWEHTKTQRRDLPDDQVVEIDFNAEKIQQTLVVGLEIFS